MNWAQWLILLTGPTGVLMTQIPATEPYACLVGLMGQVGWFHETLRARQWGMFAASFAYAAAWVVGFWRYWL